MVEVLLVVYHTASTICTHPQHFQPPKPTGNNAMTAIATGKGEQRHTQQGNEAVAWRLHYVQGKRATTGTQDAL